MSDAKVCDYCGAKLILDGPGRSDANGEIAGWVRVVVTDAEWDACTRSCATQLLADDGPVRPVIDARIRAGSTPIPVSGATPRVRPASS
jgi:hypothetical protein